MAFHVKFSEVGASALPDQAFVPIVWCDWCQTDATLLAVLKYGCSHSLVSISS